MKPRMPTPHTRRTRGAPSVRQMEPGDSAAGGGVPDARTGAGAPPRFATLSRQECEAILARNSVGRLAYSFHDRVDIAPIHYVYADGWLYGRTSLGSKLTLLRHSRWVAFEVDEVEGTFEWRSVVARGAFYELSPDGAPREAEAWERGIDLLRRLVPETWTSTDPAPGRTVVFRIHIDEMTGRAATMRSGSGR